MMAIDEAPLGGVNFGWPIASYGEHYDGEYRQEAPLKKSHANLGFREPVAFWVPSIGVSSVATSPFAFDGQDTIAVGALGDAVNEGDLSIHFMSSQTLGGKSSTLAVLPLGERVRSLVDAGDGVLLASADSGALLRITRQ